VGADFSHCPSQDRCQLGSGVIFQEKGRLPWARHSPHLSFLLTLHCLGDITVPRVNQVFSSGKFKGDLNLRVTQQQNILKSRQHYWTLDSWLSCPQVEGKSQWRSLPGILFSQDADYYCKSPAQERIVTGSALPRW
jgi:hypothetical protein